MPGTTTTALAAASAPSSAQVHVLSDWLAASTVDLRSRAYDPLPKWLPGELDLSSSHDRMLLKQLDELWPDLMPAARLSCLRQIQFTISVDAPDTADIALLPGGIVAMASPDGFRVPDPQSVTTYSEVPAAALLRAVRRCRSAVTLTHTPDGVVAVAGVPAVLAPQSVTLLADAARLPRGASLNGPALIQWGQAGATCWTMAAAPSLAGLAVRAAGLRLDSQTPAVSPELWAATRSAECRDLCAPGITEMVSDLLTDEVSDELRYAIIGRCVDGAASLADTVAAVLSAIPASFEADCSRRPGELPATWFNGVSVLRDAAPGHAMMGLEQVVDPHRAIDALRKQLATMEATLFLETGTDAQCSMVPVGSDAALFLLRRAGAEGRIGVLFASEEMTPTDLYAIANGLAGAAGATVTVAAPACGLCHRVTWDQREAGNATWFGMGVGLDELEFLSDLDLQEF